MITASAEITGAGIGVDVAVGAEVFDSLGASHCDEGAADSQWLTMAALEKPE